MRMKIKLNRGPMKGKYYEVQDDSTSRLNVEEPLSTSPRYWENLDPMAEIPVRRGHYQRSNVTLKNGAVVFEWMGWKQ